MDVIRSDKKYIYTKVALSAEDVKHVKLRDEILTLARNSGNQSMSETL